MSKMIFKFLRSRDAEALTESLSLMFLTPRTNIKAEDCWASSVPTSKRIDSLTTQQLLTYSVCKIFKVPAVTIVDFKKPFNSDEKFIAGFKENYLGTIRDKISKSQLVSIVSLQYQKSYRSHLDKWIHPNFKMLKDSFLKAGLVPEQVEELERLYNANSKPVQKWIEESKLEIDEQIKPLTKFIARGF